MVCDTVSIHTDPLKIHHSGSFCVATTQRTDVLGAEKYQILKGNPCIIMHYLVTLMCTLQIQI